MKMRSSERIDGLTLVPYNQASAIVNYVDVTMWRRWLISSASLHRLLLVFLCCYVYKSTQAFRC